MRRSQFFQCFLLKFGVSVVLQFCVCAGDDTQTYIMSEKCGSVLDMAERHLTALHLRLTDLPTYRPHMSCSLVLRAPPQHQLLMVVQRLDIDAGRFAGACTDFFSAWDGEFGNRTTYVEGLNDKICGQGAPAPVTSKGRSVTLYFDSNSVEEGSGFSLLFTAFRHGNCTDEDFRCDNGRCIDKRLKCDDDDNCGDDSDICLVSVTTAALVLIIITVVGCIVFAIVFLYWQRDRLLGRKKSADIADVSQPTESTTASTAP